MKDIIINCRNLSNPTSGVQRYTEEIISRLHDDLEIISPKLNLNRVFGHFWEQFVLPLRVKREKMLWSSSNTGPLLVRKQVITIHDMAVFDFPEGFTPLFSAWYRFLLPLVIQNAKKIISVSEFTKSQILKHIEVNPEKIVVIYNGVGKRFYPVGLDEQVRVRKKIGIPSSNYILALGSIEPRKNIQRLLNGWEIAQRELSDDIILVLAGGQGKSNVFSRVIIEDLPPRVVFTGQVSDDDLPALYTGAIAMVYPSLYEGFGLPPIESMACGTPVIVSNTTSLPEVVGDAGLYIDPYNIEEIASAIYTMVTNNELYVTLIRRGEQRAASYTWQRTAARSSQVLAEVMDND